MSADAITDATPLPRRLTWFAPWTWPRWQRWLLAVLALVLYIEMPVPLTTILNHSGVNRPGLRLMMLDTLEIIWAPLAWAYQNVFVVERFYNVQFEAAEWAVDWVFGPLD